MKRSNLVLALAALATALPSRLAQADAASDLQEAVAAFQSADYKKVVEATKGIPDDAPEAPKARYLLGETHLILGEPAQAEEAFRFTVEKRPQFVPAKVGLGRALTAEGSLDDAKKVLTEAIAADPKDAAAKRALGELLVKQGELAAADKALDEAWKAAPGDPFTARAMVEARLRADEPEKALQVAARLVKADAKHPMGPFLQALALEKLKKDDEAIKAYEKAIALDDKFLDAHKNLAILCHTKNPTYADKVRTEKAMKHYERYFELGGSDEELKKMYDTLKAFFTQNGGGK
jgi:tetratricopeptide (TPR) repeat protein